MTFFERYAKIAEQNNIDPCSQKASDLFGVTKATISAWNVKSTTPKGETIALMADKLNVSADYLLGRTDDPTDYAKTGTGGSPTPRVVQKIPVAPNDTSVIRLYNRLDDADKLKVEGVIQGMLMQDKYLDQTMLNAAHVRTDVAVTPEMISHDERLMDDDNF